MTEESVHRFEASDIDPNLSGDQASLIMETALDGRVVVEMRRGVFVALFERMKQALDDEASRAPPQSNA